MYNCQLIVDGDLILREGVICHDTILQNGKSSHANGAVSPAIQNSSSAFQSHTKCGHRPSFQCGRWFNRFLRAAGEFLESHPLCSERL